MNYSLLALPVLLVMVQLFASQGCSTDFIGSSGSGAVERQDGVVGEAAEARASLRVMTFNIRWQGHYDGKFYDSGFARRKPLILDVLTKYDADIIGLQEASIEQRSALAPDLTLFGMFPGPYEVGDECILYRLDRFDLRAGGQENLRSEPEKAGTNIGVRDFVWVHLQDRIGNQSFYVLNLHLDHRSSERGRQLDGILTGEWIRNREFADPVVLIGDFNGRPDQPRYLYLTGQRDYAGKDDVMVTMPMPMLDTFAMANPNALYSTTMNTGHRTRGLKNRIDYVFVPEGSGIVASGIIYYQKNGVYPSDHFPLISEFELQ
jgi:endonuclease/exonuclease/phosphatase family metal-dependent hydrolase